MTGAPGAKLSRAVLIGTARYDHLEPIPAAAANIDDLADLLTGPGGAFTVEQCATVLDPDRDTLGASVGKAAREATDILLVYYAGHGLIDRRGRLHLTVPGSDPDDIRWTTVPFEALRDEILDSAARARVVILDCCFAGRAFEAMADVSGLIAGQTELRGTYTITSSSANEPSLAPTGHSHTAFTGALLAAATALPGGTLDELYQETDQHLHRSGHPRPRRRNIDAAGQLRLFGQIGRVGTFRGDTDAGQTDPMSISADMLAERGEKAEAETRYRRDADDGDTDARNNLEVPLADRGEKAEAEAETWFRHGADVGDADAMCNLAFLLNSRGEKAEAETWFRSAAEAGSRDAMVMLAALLYQRGERAEAETWFRRIAEAGDPGAMDVLVRLLTRRGEKAEAETWSRRADEVRRTVAE